ncbi:MAG: HlyD family efflux transporter periplasmic adaptor subunit [Candidatus Accumulibacter sp.]|nr:HlyD family efflux transporter periplasmic adaptor subunit [Accumulibacter sp.]
MHNDMLNWPTTPPRAATSDEHARRGASARSTVPTPVQRWLADYCERSTIASCGVVVGLAAGTGADKIEVLVEWPVAGDQNQPLIGSATAAFKRGQPLVIVPPIALPDAHFERIVALPLKTADQTRGAVAIGLRTTDAALIQGFLADLQRAGDDLCSLLGGTSTVNSIAATQLLQWQATLLTRNRLQDSALELVNELAATLSFDRVSLGVIDNSRNRIVALSYNAEFKSSQELLRSLGAAMDEAVDQGCTLVHPARPGDKPLIVLAHAALAVRSGTAVCSIPLIKDGKPVGALTFERAGGNTPLQSEVVLCEHLASLIAPIVELKQRADRPMRARVAEALVAAWHRVRHGEDARPRMVAIGIFVALLVLTLLPLPYRISAPAHIEGAEQRVLAAPMDGFLRQAHVRPGDVVKAGDVLIELVDQDLQLEMRKWQGELSQHENTFIAAMARNDRALFSVSQAKAAEARAQLELIRGQLSRMQVLAPIDGMVIKGDLTQALGAPVRRGEELMVLAPRGQYRLIIDVDEQDVTEIVANAHGQVALSALPGDNLDFKVERVIPVATSKDGRNVFEIEATPLAVSDTLRPGMQGVAKIRAGSQPLAWTLSHRLTDWLRLKVWSWWG